MLYYYNIKFTLTFLSGKIMIEHILKKLNEKGWSIVESPRFKGISGLYHNYKYIIISSKKCKIAIEELTVFDSCEFLKCMGKSIDTRIPVIAICEKMVKDPIHVPEVPYIKVVLKSDVSSLEYIVEELASERFEW